RSFPAPFSIVGLKVGRSQIALSPFDIFTICAVLVVMVGLLVLFRWTSTGLRMRAAAFEPEVARLLGVRVGRVLTLGWALAAVAGSLAGLLVAPKLFLYPNNMDAVLVFGFTAAILGGLDSPAGAVAGVVVFWLSDNVGAFTDLQLSNVAAYTIALAGLTVLTGHNGQLSLGHGAFIGIGAYTTALILQHTSLPIIVVVLAAIGVSA